MTGPPGDPAACPSDVSDERRAVTAVIVTYNSGQVIAAALQALRACPAVRHTIVVDNASSDQTVPLVTGDFPQVELIVSPRNIGFGPANNLGLQRVRTEFAFVLNPDALVTAEAVETLIQVADENPGAAIVGPVLQVPGTSRPLVRIGSVWAPEKIPIPVEREIQVEFLSGAALFMRMSLVRRSGFFDPKIFLFHEDDDICHAAGKAGYTLILTSRAMVSHSVGQSSPPKPELIAFKQYHYEWSRLYLEQKTNGRQSAVRLARQTLGRLARRRALAQLTRNKSRYRLLKARTRAVQCFLSRQMPTTDPQHFVSGMSATTALEQGNSQMELTECDLCGNRNFRLISETDRHGKDLETVICEKCGLVRHATIPTEAELQQFYAGSYRKDYNGEQTPGARRIMRAWKNGQRICRQVSPLLEAGSRVLEVGAGIGCTVKVFEQAGFAAQGIDPGGEFLRFSRDQLHAQVEVCNLYDLPVQNSFDAVLLVHVIEHLRSPRLALERIAGLLKPGGMLYVECPNLQAPFAYRSHLFHTAHIHNFVPSTLQMLAESCGFRLRKRFGDSQDVNLQMLFQHSAEPQLQVETDNFERTLRDLNRADVLPYHLRLRYFTDRVRKLGSYAAEFLQAKRFVADIVRQCRQESSASASPSVAAAADDEGRRAA
ncbi:MAG: methyltransferase domain-containing protein [Fuerstiella sp.]